jgi:hypothetical protein
VEKVFGIADLPEALVVDALDRLCTEGYAVNDKGTWVVKSVPAGPEGPNRFTLVVDEVVRRVKDRHGSVDAYQRVVVERSLERVLYAIFDELGSEVARILKENESSAKAFQSIERIVRDTFTGFKAAELGDTDKLRESTITSLKDVFEKPTPSFSEAIWRIGSAYVALRVLAADPHLSEMRRDAFSGGLLVLDTNVVLDLVCEGCSAHVASRSLLKSCMSLGYKVVVQKSTEEELNRIIAKDTLRFKAQRVGYLDLSFAARDIPKTFYENRSKFRDWYAYIAHLKLEYSNLLSEFRIERQDFESLDLEVADLAEAARIVAAQPSPLEKTKDRDAVDHDSVSLVAIQNLKVSSPSVLAGPWFVTRDNGVLRASREYARLKSAQTEAAIGCPALLQLVSPFLSGLVAQEDLIKAFSKILRAQVVSFPEESVKAFVTYSLEQAGVAYDENLVVSIASEAHANRTFQKALADQSVPDLLAGLSQAVQKASVDAVEIKAKELALERILQAIKGSQKLEVVGTTTTTSGLTKLVSDISNKLIINVHALGKPEREMEVQDAMETMLATLDYDFARSKESHGFAGVGVVPDFTVRLNQVKIPIEVKFTDSDEKVKRVVEEMAADQTKYHSQYNIILFVVYDLGFIVDVGKFSKDFETAGDLVLVVKH